jgi:membrane protease YdiL (CAAX protease family)
MSSLIHPISAFPAGMELKQPESWPRTLLIGIGLAALVFIGMYVSKKAGFRRDLSKFKDVQGNLEVTVYGVLYALIGAGFYEEFTFRGFLIQGLASSRILEAGVSIR